MSGWVLITDGGSGQGRSALAAVRALAAAGFRVAVTVPAHGRSLAGASRFAAARIAVPAADEPGYADAVRAEAARRSATVIAASDAALLALGVEVGHLVDKQRLAEAARAVGLAVPAGQALADRAALAAAAPDLAYPVVVKPLVSRVPATRADTAADVAALPDMGAVLVQPWLSGAMRSVSGVMHDGRLLATCHQQYLRTWPPDCGTSCAAVTVAGTVEVEERLAALLAGYDGVFQAQFLGGALIDLNPRVYGSLPLAVRAGANLPAIHVRATRGEIGAPVRARAGVRYRWIEGDLRHVLAAWRSGRLPLRAAAAALRPRRGTAHSVVSLSDPLPILARLRHAAGRR